MHGLLSKLAGLDSSAERGLRVVEFFDQLVLHRADAEAVTRATAVLAETVTGAILDRTGEVVCVSPSGERLRGASPSPHALVHDVVVDDAVIGRVWLERSTPDDAHEWDELIVERMARCLATLSALHGDARPASDLGLTDPAVLHVLIRDGATETETARAARLLGFGVGESVRVLAVQTTGEVGEVTGPLRAQLAAEHGSRTVAAALSSRLAVMIIASREVAPVSVTGAAICIGPVTRVEDSRTSWAMARRGVRFAALGGRWPTCTTTDDLGCLVVLADLDPAQIAALPDVQAVAALAAGKSGDADIELLDGLGWLTSLRDLADALHMHHSSVAYRVGNLSAALGYDVRTQNGRFRTRTALVLWRLYCARQD